MQGQVQKALKVNFLLTFFSESLNSLGMFFWEKYEKNAAEGEDSSRPGRGQRSHAPQVAGNHNQTSSNYFGE